MDCCKRKISEVVAARELYSLNCSMLVKQIFVSARARKRIAVLAHARKEHSSPLIFVVVALHL